MQIAEDNGKVTRTLGEEKVKTLDDYVSWEWQQLLVGTDSGHVHTNSGLPSKVFC